MVDHKPLRRLDSREQGQAAVEFVFALVWIVFLVAVIYQAVMFERDAFNKMAELRFRTFHAARMNQDETNGRTISGSIAGTPFAELVKFKIPAQSGIDPNLKYGPKSFYVHCGTKKYFPGGDVVQDALVIGFYPALGIDHYQDSSGYVAKIIGKINLFDMPCG